MTTNRIAHRRPPKWAELILVEMYGCQNTKNVEGALRLTAQTIESLGYKILHITKHQFTPGGYTILSLLSLSHFAIHTWPENRYVAIDLFSCKILSKRRKALFIQKLCEYYCPKKYSTRIVTRGAELLKR